MSKKIEVVSRQVFDEDHKLILPTKKVAIDGVVVQVDSDKTYSNGKTGKQIIEENPKPKRSKSKDTLNEMQELLNKKQRIKDTTTAKKETLTLEEKQELQRKKWRDYYQKPGMKEKYAIWGQKWRARVKAEKDAAKAELEETQSKKKSKKVVTKKK